MHYLSHFYHMKLLSCVLFFILLKLTFCEFLKLPGRYKIFSFKDEIDKDKTPIVFCPGSSGSFSQASLLAHVLSTSKNFQIFSINFNEEKTANFGFYLYSQFEYLNFIVVHLYKKYKKKLIIVGHSMGAIVALNMLDAYFLIDKIILIDLPLRETVLIWDYTANEFYKQLYTMLDGFKIMISMNTTLIFPNIYSVTGGVKDDVVPTLFTYEQKYMLGSTKLIQHITTEHLPHIWNTYNHVDILKSISFFKYYLIPLLMPQRYSPKHISQTGSPNIIRISTLPFTYDLTYAFPQVQIYFENPTKLCSHLNDTFCNFVLLFENVNILSFNQSSSPLLNSMPILENIPTNGVPNSESRNILHIRCSKDVSEAIYVNVTFNKNRDPFLRVFEKKILQLNKMPWYQSHHVQHFSIVSVTSFPYQYITYELDFLNEPSKAYHISMHYNESIQTLLPNDIILSYSVPQWPSERRYSYHKILTKYGNSSNSQLDIDAFYELGDVAFSNNPREYRHPPQLNIIYWPIFDNFTKFYNDSYKIHDYTIPKYLEYNLKISIDHGRMIKQIIYLYHFLCIRIFVTLTIMCAHLLTLRLFFKNIIFKFKKNSKFWHLYCKKFVFLTEFCIFYSFLSVLYIIICRLVSNRTSSSQLYHPTSSNLIAIISLFTFFLWSAIFILFVLIESLLITVSCFLSIFKEFEFFKLIFCSKKLAPNLIYIAYFLSFTTFYCFPFPTYFLALMSTFIQSAQPMSQTKLRKLLVSSTLMLIALFILFDGLFYYHFLIEFKTELMVGMYGNFKYLKLFSTYFSPFGFCLRVCFACNLFALYLYNHVYIPFKSSPCFKPEKHINNQNLANIFCISCLTGFFNLINKFTKFIKKLWFLVLLNWMLAFYIMFESAEKVAPYLTYIVQFYILFTLNINAITQFYKQIKLCSKNGEELDLGCDNNETSL